MSSASSSRTARIALTARAGGVVVDADAVADGRPVAAAERDADALADGDGVAAARSGTA